MEYQTRRINGEIRHFNTLKEAFDDTTDRDVWKVSFSTQTGERVRLVRYGASTVFVYSPLLPGDVENGG